MVIDFKNLDMQTDSIVEVFRQCIRLCYIHILNLDTSNVANMSYMFKYCYNLREIVVPKDSYSRELILNALRLEKITCNII